MDDPNAKSELSSRRRWLKAGVQTAGVAVLASTAAIPALSEPNQSLPLRSAFPITGADVYLNNAGSHPFSQGAIDAIQTYLQRKAAGQSGRGERADDQVKSDFAALINAPVSSISFVPRTIAGEGLVVSGLDLAHTRGNIVTDELHFQGSLNLYRTLQSRGVDVRIIQARNWRIELADLDKAVDRNTKLVALSAVSQVNGFQHNLKAVCDLAHARGAYVYADMVQAIGATPIDVRSSGLDFGACGAQKWLMGDEGLGFLYAREGLLEEVAQRTQYGVRQITGAQNRLVASNLRPDGTAPELSERTALYLEVGAISQTVMAALSYSLPLIRRIGVEAIQSYNAGLLAKVRKEMPRLGYESATPEDSRAPMAGFSYPPEKRQAISAKLKDARVEVKVDQKVIRVSPSIYNNVADVDKLLEALA
jgi:selenocysteine lyase/cysteine desulfurase